ncbi:unnamed protein product [Penicillium roqueforti FM164]|uniref:Genomic scaffold, ProqFM164S02 n=1 Tax=Penicillium roqueforti (strain FM164) TaxID=1365484 RepID=W6Q347_PENRF|nr:unnamed protein product [Penicillium roqueforti FM164]
MYLSVSGDQCSSSQNKQNNLQKLATRGTVCTMIGHAPQPGASQGYSPDLN